MLWDTSRWESGLDANSSLGIAAEPLISFNVPPRVYAAMQTSRSVSIATSRAARSTTGTQPQSFSHIICAARLSASSGLHAITSSTINSATFMLLIRILHRKNLARIICKPGKSYRLCKVNADAAVFQKKESLRAMRECPHPCRRRDLSRGERRDRTNAQESE